MTDTTRTKKKRVSGWLSIKAPEDLERALTRMMNRILVSPDPLAHCGRFASLANAWTNAKRLELESGEWKKLREDLDRLEEQLKRDRNGGWR